MPYPLSSNRAFSRIASRAGASVFVTAGIIVARAFADPAFPTNIPSLSRIPPLRPPKPEIPPTFLEQHGVALWTGIGVFVAFCALLAFYLARPRRTLPVPPGVVARDALAALNGQPEDGQALSEVSQILRRYFLAVLELAPTEITTAEFCEVIQKSERVDAPLGAKLAALLRAADERKFSPAPHPEPLRAVNEAYEIVVQMETRLAELRAAAALPAARQIEPTNQEAAG